MSQAQIDEILRRVASGISTESDARKLRRLLLGPSVTAAVARD